jgi:hypothetical protein|tara:strand:+ start:183 stop:362 length:180 start_codon:yes stop_codon:yes gene_type:complete
MKQNTKLRLKTEACIKKMKQEHLLGNITTEELFDLEWFYFENWVDPIQFQTKLGKVVLN